MSVIVIFYFAHFKVRTIQFTYHLFPNLDIGIINPNTLLSNNNKLFSFNLWELVFNLV